jgi:hypothetical protein
VSTGLYYCIDFYRLFRFQLVLPQLAAYLCSDTLTGDDERCGLLSSCSVVEKLFVGVSQ